MSVPHIRGYIEPQAQDTLADLWTLPEGLPEALWPEARMRSISPTPVEWLTVEENYHTDEEHGGVGCVLTPVDQGAAAIAGISWRGRDLGSVHVGDDDGYEDGLSAGEADVRYDFFAQVRKPMGTREPVVEISYPFLWYWDAHHTRNGWAYVDRAGREHELLRVNATKEAHRVEVRALEFRQWLAISGRSAVVQIDVVPKRNLPKFKRVAATLNNDWAHFSITATHDMPLSSADSFSRLLGQYLVTGKRNARVPYWDLTEQKPDFPQFIYGVNKATGEVLTHACDPDALGTYFDKDNSRLHYLTPVYFRREVLQPYQAEPHRYTVSSHRLDCLGLWGVAIGFSTAGLVEVYLGDLGRDLPADEWGHWLSYNVPPDGQMDEGRFRRDFLAQWADSKDAANDIRQARHEANEASVALLSQPLWRDLPDDTAAEFASLIGPLTEDPAGLGASLLVLAKALIDAIDPKSLKAYLKTAEKGEQSLGLLQRFAEQLGDTENTTAPLRQLQAYRSSGGVAHLAGSRRTAAAVDLGISGLSNKDAFEHVSARLVTSLQRLTELIALATDSPNTGRAD